MTRDQLIDLALAYDADDQHVREEVAAWLCTFGPFAVGVATDLMRREPRTPVCRRRRATA